LFTDEHHGCKNEQQELFYLIKNLFNGFKNKYLCFFGMKMDQMMKNKET